MEIIGLRLPFIKKGDDLVKLIIEGLEKENKELLDGDVLVITEKIAAKAQGRLVELKSVKPSKKALTLAKETGKDPRIVELILNESKEVLKIGPNFIITETNEGFICANAGIDSSNVEEGRAKLLPKDPDGMAKELKKGFDERTGRRVGVVIADSFGRPFRFGSVGVAIGAAGVPTLWDRRGEEDLFGRRLETTRVAVADLLASAANLVTGDASEGIPVALIRGLDFKSKDGIARDLIRDRENDLFRY